MIVDSCCRQVLSLGVNQELLKEAANEAWVEFLGVFADKYDGFRRVVKQLATLDCLFSLAHLANQSGYVRPIFGKCVTAFAESQCFISFQ